MPVNGTPLRAAAPIAKPFSTVVPSVVLPKKAPKVAVLGEATTATTQAEARRAAQAQAQAQAEARRAAAEKARYVANAIVDIKPNSKASTLPQMSLEN